MVAPALVDRKIERGRRLLKKLDDSPFPVTAAFWYYFPEAEQWRLVIASPTVESQGRQAAYTEIHKIQRRGVRLPVPHQVLLGELALLELLERQPGAKVRVVLQFVLAEPHGLPQELVERDVGAEHAGVVGEPSPETVNG